MAFNQSDSNPTPPSESASYNSGPPRRMVSIEEALEFITDVKSAFATEMSVYQKFIGTFADFKGNRIEIDDCLKRVGSLLRGHAQLINAFNLFVPNGYALRADGNSVYLHQPHSVEEIPMDFVWNDAPAQVVPCLDP